MHKSLGRRQSAASSRSKSWYGEFQQWVTLRYGAALYGDGTWFSPGGSKADARAGRLTLMTR